jgi:hypothetical protein
MLHAAPLIESKGVTRATNATAGYHVLTLTPSEFDSRLGPLDPLNRCRFGIFRPTRPVLGVPTAVPEACHAILAGGRFQVWC